MSNFPDAQSFRMITRILYYPKGWGGRRPPLPIPLRGPLTKPEMPWRKRPSKRATVRVVRALPKKVVAGLCHPWCCRVRAEVRWKKNRMNRNYPTDYSTPLKWGHPRRLGAAIKACMAQLELGWSPLPAPPVRLPVHLLPTLTIRLLACTAASPSNPAPTGRGSAPWRPTTRPGPSSSTCLACSAPTASFTTAWATLRGTTGVILVIVPTFKGRSGNAGLASHFWPFWYLVCAVTHPWWHATDVEQPVTCVEANTILPTKMSPLTRGFEFILKNTITNVECEQKLATGVLVLWSSARHLACECDPIQHLRLLLITMTLKKKRKTYSICLLSVFVCLFVFCNVESLFWSLWMAHCKQTAVAAIIIKSTWRELSLPKLGENVPLSRLHIQWFTEICHQNIILQLLLHIHKKNYYKNCSMYKSKIYFKLYFSYIYIIIYTT